MELTNEFKVDVPVHEAWKVLTDVERIAPLLPGAQLQEVEGDEYRGVVRVKVGPITAQYRGAATFQELDEPGGRVVLKASGRDTRGQGNASATITATMAPEGAATKVTVVTELTVTGKVAQFGRGVLADVSAKLMGQFADALAADLAAGKGSPGPADGPAGEHPAAKHPAGEHPAAENPAGEHPAGEHPAAENPVGENRASGGIGAARSMSNGSVRRIEQPEAEPVDLLEMAGGSVLRRVAPIVGVCAVVVLVLARRRVRRLARGSGPQ